MLLAADQSLNWTAGANPRSLGANGELAFTYDANDKVQTLSATIADGDTITLSGDAIDFAADATISLTGLGDLAIATAVTGAGNLTVTNASSRSGYLEYGGRGAESLLPSKSYRTIFENCSIDDIQILHTINNSLSMANSQVHYPHVIRRFTEGGVKKMTMQMQIQYYASSASSDVTKCVVVEFKQNGNNVVGKAVAAYYAWAAIEGEDMEAMYKMWLANPDASARIEVLPTAVRASDNSGDYGIVHFAANCTSAPKVRLTGNLTGLAGKLIVAKGAVVDGCGADVTKLASSSDVSGGIVVGEADGKMTGSMGGNDNGTLTLSATGATSRSIILAVTNTMANSVGAGGRADAVKDKFGRVVIRGDSANGATMTCVIANGAYPGGWNLFPRNGLVEVRDGGILDLRQLASRGGPNSNGILQNDTATIRVYKGGKILHYNNWTLRNEQKIELRGGTFESTRSNATVAYVYLNNLLMEDGARLVAPKILWVGNQAGPQWKVRGSSPSIVDGPVNLLGLSGKKQVLVTNDVFDVTGDAQPDFIYNQPLGTHTGDGQGFTNVVVVKIGNGTVLCNSTIEMCGGVDVREGTWMLGASGSWLNSYPLSLDGGTFAVSNNTSNAIGSLSVGSHGGTIELGTGATLSFPAPSGTWAGTVTIRGFRENAIRFGTDLSALDVNQYKFRTAEGKKLHLMNNGYLAPRGIMISIQ